MLTRLYADNYRCLVEFQFRPQAKQLVIGTNGAGKTTSLDILSLIRDFSVRGQPCADRLGGGTLTRWQQVERQRFELDVAGNDTEYRYELVIDEWGNPRRPRVRTEQVLCGGQPVFLFEEGSVHLFNDRHEDKVQYEFDWHRSALATIAERRDNTKLTWFKRWLAGVVHVQINPWAMSARSERESREPARDLANFADWFRHLKLESGREVFEAVAALCDAIPGLETLEAKEAGLDVRVVQAEIAGQPGGKPEAYALHDLSEGQRTLIALYVLTHCALTTGATLLIDEPDNFIALPEIQPWLMDLLDRVDERNAQVILVSHHPELLNQLAGQGGVIFSRPDGLQTRVQPFPAPQDGGLTPAEIVARGWERA